MIGFIILVPFDEALERVAVFSPGADDNMLVIAIVDSNSKEEASRIYSSRLGVQIQPEELRLFATLENGTCRTTYYTCAADLSTIPTGKTIAVYALDALKLRCEFYTGRHIVELAKIHLEQSTPVVHMRIGA